MLVLINNSNVYNILHVEVKKKKIKKDLQSSTVISNYFFRENDGVRENNYEVAE